MRLKDIYLTYKQETLKEANLRQLFTKTANETPKLAQRGEQLVGRVRYFGLSEDGTLNFKVGSQSQSGKFYYVYIEAPDILKFAEVVEEGDHFTEADLNRLLTMKGFRIHCSDPSFLYYAFQYMATQGNYEIEPETRAPKRNNVLLQGGTCFVKDTPVLTLNGLIPIQDIKVGDLVYTHTGKLRRVTETSSHFATNVVDLKVANTHIGCTDDHRFYTCKVNRQKNKFDWVPVKDFGYYDRLVTPTLTYPKTEDPGETLAFLLGFYLGDGTSELKYMGHELNHSKYPIIDKTKVLKQIMFAIDKRFKDIYQAKFNELGFPYTYSENDDTNNGYISIRDEKLSHWIYKHGGLNHKGHFKEYSKFLTLDSLGWSHESKIALLSGLLWADGSINFHKDYPQFSLGLTNHQIISVLHQMFISYGLQYDRFDREPTNLCTNPKAMSILRFNGRLIQEVLAYDINLWNIKWQSLNRDLKLSTRQNKITIDGYTTHTIYSVTPIEDQIVYNIGVEVDESYLVTKNAYAAHNCKHLHAVIKNMFENSKMKQQISKDIDNYLRMLSGFDYEDYQQANHARQIQQQNRSVKWKNNPSDYMNDYFAHQAKVHPFLDDHDVKKSLKKEMGKYLNSKPDADLDTFLRDYFQMTKKAFADDMEVPETSIDDWFDELGFTEKKEKIGAKRNAANQPQDTPDSDQDLDVPEETDPKGVNAGIVGVKDSEQLNEDEGYTVELGQNLNGKPEPTGDAGRIKNWILYKFYHTFNMPFGVTVTPYNGDADENFNVQVFRPGFKDQYIVKLENNTYNMYVKDSKDLSISLELNDKTYEDPMPDKIKADLWERGSLKSEQLSLNLNETEETKEYYTPAEAHKAYQEYLAGHIQNVIDTTELIIKYCNDNEFIQEEKQNLRRLVKDHDKSKYKEPEYIPYLNHFYPTCPEEEQREEAFNLAVMHHCANNKHHWDCWLDQDTLELKEITDEREYKLYCVERVADWLSMAAQHREYKDDWYQYNKSAMKMPDWAFDFIEYIYSKLPDDYYLSLSYKGTRGDKDESGIEK